MPDTNELLPVEEDEQYQHLVRDLRYIYRADGQRAQQLARIQQRLLNSEGSIHPQPRHGTPGIQQNPGNLNPTRAPFTEARPWQRRLSLIAAALVVALLVSSLLLVLSRSHRGSIGSPSATPIGGLNTLLSLHMIDASTGWALTAQAVLRTTDGGVQWKNVTPPGTTLTQGSIADFGTASMASTATPQPGEASIQILHTVDGGQTWQQATIQMPFPRQISFIDAQHGWVLAAVRSPGGAAEPVAVFRTTDGGKTWANVTTVLFADATPPGRLPYGGLKTGMRFLNASTGWVTGNVSLSNLAWLYVTHDGGSTWHQQSLLVPPGVPPSRLLVLSPTFFSAIDGVLPV